MNRLLLPTLLLPWFAVCQSSINNGSFGSDTMLYALGEVFVVPADIQSSQLSGFPGIVFLPESALGITSSVYSDDIRVYPNPTQDRLYFASGSAIISGVTICDMQGKIIATLKVEQSVVRIPDIAPGHYIIIPDNTSIKPFKIIKN